MKLSKLQMWSAYLGNFFEHYDTALFGFLSPFLAPLFFPGTDPLTALIYTYAMIPIGMIARPFGAIAFGYIGDGQGRQRALFLSMLGMALVTGYLAICPTYEQAGLFAPFFFCLGKFLQNFLSAGETVGGALFVLENSDEKYHDIQSSLFNASTIGGILLAGAGVGLLGILNITDWGWRWLYGFGCTTALFGCFLRSGSPADPLTPRTSPFKEIVSVMTLSKGPLFTIMLCSGLGYATYSIALILMNGLIPLVTSYTKAEMAMLNTALLVLDFASLPFFGWLSFKLGREKVMICAAWLIAITSIPLFTLLQEGNFITIVAVRMLFVFLGVAFFAPFYAWSSRLIPSKGRYLILSFGYAVGSQLVGAPTTALSLWLFKHTGMVTSAAWYITFLAVACAIGIAKVSKKQSMAYEYPL